MTDTIRGTVNGTVLIAVVEGSLIGIGYLVTGVPHALLLTFLTMAFAMVPLGAWAVFSSASVLLLLQGGSALAAVGVFVFGAVVRRPSATCSSGPRWSEVQPVCRSWWP